MHHLLETGAMLEPSQGHVMFFFIMKWVPAVSCVRRLDRRDGKMKRAQWEEGKRPRMLTIYTNHQGGNIVHKHKTIKFDLVGE